MAFTTWAALYSMMLDDLASGGWKIKSYQMAEGVSTTYRDFSEFKSALEYVQAQKDKEASIFVGRTYAQQGGGGRW